MKSGSAAQNRFSNGLPVLVVLLVLAYLVLVPLGILIVSSLTPSGLPFDPGWTIGNYFTVYGDPEFWKMVWTTVQFAVGSMLGAMVLGVALAWAVERTDLPGKRGLRICLTLPMAIPPFLLAIGWILLLSPRIGFINTLIRDITGIDDFSINIYSLGGMIFVQALSLVPSTFLILCPAFRNMDPSLEEAAMASGAGRYKLFRRIFVPLLSPSLLAAAIFMLMVGFLVFDVPGTLGMPVNIFVLSSRIVYLATDSAGGMSAYHIISTIAVFFLVILLLQAWAYHRLTRNASRFVTVTGKNFRPRLIKLGRWKLPVLGAIFVYFCLATIIPLGILGWTSLMPWLMPPSMKAISLASWSNHLAFFTNSLTLRALGNSLLIGIVAATVVALFSVLVSWIVVRKGGKSGKVVDFLAFLPIAIPGTMIGVALVYVYLNMPFLSVYGSVWIIVIAYITTYIPFGTRSTNSVMLQLHKELEEAARTSGASWGRVMRRVVLPLTLPAALAVWIWVIAHCIRELSSALLLQGGENQTLPVVLWNFWVGGEPNKAAAVGLWLVVLLFLTMLIWQMWGGRKADNR
ncbi:iron ABC transporter permease [Pusillimonas sp. MFBS29]|uniref:ABC transporter permease n=1 Tax=Pusillimonas sp. MFBS29 TaxID=2886690 RepID=UPI001D10DB7D|nr:iron ABC transporter permease [Pusillimonas sp. MFBS29]MCC2597206.1 iron ABC transporter permease [Pusillimonas sp. MFBS29]